MYVACSALGDHLAIELGGEPTNMILWFTDNQLVARKLSTLVAGL